MKFYHGAESIDVITYLSGRVIMRFLSKNRNKTLSVLIKKKWLSGRLVAKLKQFSLLTPHFKSLFVGSACIMCSLM